MENGNQPHLIDGDKLMEWLEEAKQNHDGVSYSILKSVERACLEGRFDPDPAS